MTEIVLPYPRDVVPQTESWSCGPGAAEIVLRGLGKDVSERQLIRDIGTTTNGTDYIGLIEQRALDKYDPVGQWRSVYLPQDPPTKAQKDAFWEHVVQSIRGNKRGLVLNWVVPPWNRPKPVAPSTVAFTYPNAWVWHYVACMGFSDDGARKCWIADSGFSPGGGWVSWEQTVSLITPKGYAYSAAPITSPPPVEPVTMTWLNEFDAITYSDPEAIAVVVKAAQKGDARAKRALSRIEQTNPAALQAFIERAKA